jgi:hypothetical protein
MPEAIYVNPTAVRILTRSGDGSRIEFGPNEWIIVPIPVEQVRGLLDEAMNEG